MDTSKDAKKPPLETGPNRFRNALPSSLMLHQLGGKARPAMRVPRKRGNKRVVMSEEGDKKEKPKQEEAPFDFPVPPPLPPVAEEAAPPAVGLMESDNAMLT
jgi:hypothetical protein